MTMPTIDPDFSLIALTIDTRLIGTETLLLLELQNPDLGRLMRLYGRLSSISTEYEQMMDRGLPYEQLPHYHRWLDLRDRVACAAGA